MCGIFGIISEGRDISSLRAGAEVAVKALDHRGPDDSGLVDVPGALIGATRLAIIDLDHAHQPMASRDGRYVIMFNGEIYNYRELRSALQSKGHVFSAHSDTETLLAAYQEYGPGCLEYLRGMFAFVVYDTRTGDFFAARDRCGIKPFYYAQIDDLFVFSSEMRPIYETGLLEFAPNSKHFNEFLIFGYIAGEDTLHAGIKELNPGHFISRNRGRVEVRRYWYPFPDEETDTSPDALATVDELDRRLREAVELWTTADVEVAALLSGGVDSTIVAKFAADLIPNLRTITASFDDESLRDELRLAKLVADQIGSRALVTAFEDSYFADNLERLAGHFDEPVLDAANYTLMAICETLRGESDLKVALCGEGADEVFAGYERHRAISERYAQTADPSVLMYAFNTVAIPRLRLFTDDASIANPYRAELVAQLRSRTPVNKLLELDQLTFLTTRLHSQDRVGMMFGLEIRTPFLDHPLVEFVNGLPPGLKIRDGFHKWILRKVDERHLPAEVAWHPTKSGLWAPIARMLHNGPLHDLYRDVIRPGAHVDAFYSVDGMQRLLDDHNPAQPGRDHANTLSRVLALELWLSSFQA